MTVVVAVCPTPLVLHSPHLWLFGFEIEYGESAAEADSEKNQNEKSKLKMKGYPLKLAAVISMILPLSFLLISHLHLLNAALS